MKPWVRWAITGWVCVVVPLLAFELITVMIHLPRIVATAAASADKLWHDTGKAFGAGKIFNGISDILQLVVLAIPIVGIGLMLWRVAKGAVTWAWTHTAGRPVRRGLSGVAGAVVVALLALAWIPRHNYRSIQPHERGTIGEAAIALRYLPRQPNQLDVKATAKDLSKAPATTVPSSTSTTVQSRPTTTVAGLTSTSRPAIRTSTTIGQIPTTFRPTATTVAPTPASAP